MTAVAEFAPIDYRGHALERYGERVRPTVLPGLLEQELRAVADAHGAIVAVPPLWAVWDQRTDAYLLIGEDVAFPLLLRAGRYLATTCLIRGWCPPTVRAARRRQRIAARNRRNRTRR